MKVHPDPDLDLDLGQEVDPDVDRDTGLEQDLDLDIDLGQDLNQDTDPEQDLGRDTGRFVKLQGLDPSRDRGVAQEQDQDRNRGTDPGQDQGRGQDPERGQNPDQGPGQGQLSCWMLMIARIGFLMMKLIGMSRSFYKKTLNYRLIVICSIFRYGNPRSFPRNERGRNFDKTPSIVCLDNDAQDQNDLEAVSEISFNDLRTNFGKHRPFNRKNSM